MRATFALSAVIALVVGINMIAQAEDKPDPREELVTAIPEAIRLLKDEKYVELLQAFADPKLLEEETRSESLEHFDEGFAQRKAARLLTILQKIEGKKPELSDDGKTATFGHDVEGEPKTIVFKRTGKNWYIAN